MGRIMVVGTDKRSLTVADILADATNHEIIKLTNITDFNSEINLFVLPIPLSTDGKHVNNTFIKLETDELKRRIKDKLFISAETLNRDDFAYRNSIPTAEGAIKLAIGATEKTLYDSNLLVTGFGRVSKILVNRLAAFSNNVTVAARKSADKAYIESLNLNFLPLDLLAKRINEFDIIFNTVPHKIFDSNVLSKSEKNSVFIELASNTLGFDTEFINQNNINFINAPGLPSKFSPFSSAKILSDTIMEIMKENNIN